MKKLSFFNISIIILLLHAKTTIDVESVESEPVINDKNRSVSFHFENKTMVIGNSADNKMLRIAYAVNRTDATNLKMDSILIGDMSGDIEFIFHFQ
jgi:hypothetical protein